MRVTGGPTGMLLLLMSLPAALLPAFASALASALV